MIKELKHSSINLQNYQLEDNAKDDCQLKAFICMNNV